MSHEHPDPRRKRVSRFARILSSALVICTSALPIRASAWRATRNGNILTMMEVAPPWGALVVTDLTDQDHKSVFCFTGPFKVRKGANYTVQVELRDGPWSNAVMTARDHNTICVNDPDKANGLFGALYKLGSVSILVRVGDSYVGHRFYRGNIPELMGQ